VRGSDQIPDSCPREEDDDPLFVGDLSVSLEMNAEQYEKIFQEVLAALSQLISEEPETFFNYRPATGSLLGGGSQFRYDVDDGREIIWMSERDGWNHLYLYDGRTGRVKNQITRGNWVVRDIDHVDPVRRQIWFQASGMNVNAFDPSPARREIAAKSVLRSVHDIPEMPRFERRHRLSIECSGVAAAVASAVRMTQNHGEIVMVGAPWGGDANSIPSSRLTRDIFFRFLKLRSGSEWEIPRLNNPYVPDSIVANVETGLQWIADGRLNVEPLITHRVDPTTGVQGAYDGLLKERDRFLGVILRWQESSG
jgi:hypothetical protein